MRSFKLLDDYIDAALKTARYEKIDNGTRVYAELRDFPGAWADGKTRDAAAMDHDAVRRDDHGGSEDRREQRGEAGRHPFP